MVRDRYRTTGEVFETSRSATSSMPSRCSIANPQRAHRNLARLLAMTLRWTEEKRMRPDKGTTS